MSVFYVIIQFMIAASITLTFIRVLRGPTMANRVVALDLMAVLAVGMMAVQAVKTGQYAIVDVAVGVGIAAFIGTAAFAVLIDRDPGADEHD